MENKANEGFLRQDISSVTEYLRSIRSPQFERHINRIKNEHKKDNVTELDSIETSLNNKKKAIRKYCSNHFIEGL